MGPGCLARPSHSCAMPSRRAPRWAGTFPFGLEGVRARAQQRRRGQGIAAPGFAVHRQLRRRSLPRYGLSGSDGANGLERSPHVGAARAARSGTGAPHDGGTTVSSAALGTLAAGTDGLEGGGGRLGGVRPGMASTPGAARRELLPARGVPIDTPVSVRPLSSPNREMPKPSTLTAFFGRVHRNVGRLDVAVDDARGVRGGRVLPAPGPSPPPRAPASAPQAASTSP